MTVLYAKAACHSIEYQRWLNDRIWTPPRFASKLFDGDRDDCSRISGLLSWHSLMPGHDGYSRTSTQTLLRALSTRSFTGLTGAGPTVSPSLSLLCNRD